VTPAAEEHRDLVADVLGVVVREVVFLQQRALVLVGLPAFLEAAAHALAVLLAAPEVRAVCPLPVALGDWARELLAAALGGELGVVFGLLERVPALAVAGHVVADAGVLVGVLDPDGRPGRRLLHRRGVATARGNAFRHRPWSPTVHLRHERDGDPRVLASDVDVAASFLSQARGLMFRRSIPADYALVFDFADADSRDVHMVFVPFDIDALWVEDREVQRVERLSAWTGRGEARCDTLVELPAGAASDVAVGDHVWLAN
jgi:uncharacterized membrane protein (UPF0127 family)